MKKLLKTAFLLFFFSFLVNDLASQSTDSTIIWQITTVDDNEYVGYILSETERAIEFKTANIGVIKLQKRQIKRQEKLISNKSTNGLLWAENRLAYRYFLRNSGIPLEKGKAYYQNAWIFLNNFDYGITDNFSLGAGIVPLFLFAGADTPIWVTPRFSVPIEENKVYIGAGALVGGVFGEFSNVGFGFGFGNVTLGNKNKNITVGLGYGFAEGEFAERPTFSLAGMLRTGKRGYLVTENYIISTGFETIVILSLGGRYVGKKITIDYGGVFIPDGDFITPWLSITLPLSE